VSETNEEYENFTFSIDKEDNRVKFIFPDDKRPNDEVKSLLRNYSFKWSSTRNAYVRKITINGLNGGRYLRNKLIEYFNKND
ncbi:hypothetical protein ABLA85_10755, partial [Xenorhabdus sp. SGI246]